MTAQKEISTTVGKIVEQRIKEGQIAGTDLFTEDELKEALLELAELYSDNQIAYERRRNELQPWFGCTKAAIDTEVTKLVEGALPKLSNPAEDPVNELVAIAKREAVL